MTPIKVIFFHRRPRPNINFSIENLFDYVRSALPSSIDAKVHVAKYYSTGLFKRLFITVEAALRQGDINHVTGDIHFVTTFLAKTKTVLTIHDVGFMQRSGRLSRWLLKMFWIVIPVKRAGIITTVSEATKKELLRYVKVRPSQIRVIYDPILPHFQTRPKPFNKACPTILQIGTKANKNIARLIDAITGLKCRVEIIGYLNDDLTQRLVNAKVNFEVFSGLSDAELFKRYEAADIISFVSVYEGFGMPIIEGNKVGRVVLTSNISSMPEIAGSAAHLVDPFDVSSIRSGILKLIEDDAYRETLITSGYENCKRFDVSRIACEYAQIYESMRSKFLRGLTKISS